MSATTRNMYGGYGNEVQDRRAYRFEMIAQEARELEINDNLNLRRGSHRLQGDAKSDGESLTSRERND